MFKTSWSLLSKSLHLIKNWRIWEETLETESLDNGFQKGIETSSKDTTSPWQTCRQETNRANLQPQDTISLQSAWIQPGRKRSCSSDDKCLYRLSYLSAWIPVASILCGIIGRGSLLGGSASLKLEMGIIILSHFWFALSALYLWFKMWSLSVLFLPPCLPLAVLFPPQWCILHSPSECTSQNEAFLS